MVEDASTVRARNTCGQDRVQWGMRWTLLFLILLTGCARTMRQTGVAQPTPAQLLAVREFMWQHRTAGAVHAYFQEGAAVAMSEDIPAAVDGLLREVRDTLHVSDDQPVHAFIVKSRDDMDRLLKLVEPRPGNRFEKLESELVRANVVPREEIPADVVTMNSRVNLRERNDARATRDYAGISR